MKLITRTEVAVELGYLQADTGPSTAAVAQFMRDALGRWGLCPRRTLFKHVRDQLRTGDLSTDDVPKVLRRLVALGECEEIAVGHEVYIAPAEPRWMATGNGLAVLLGAGVVPSTMQKVNRLDSSDLTVRLHLSSEEDAATLATRGVREVSLAEWLHTPDFLRHAARRVGGAIRSDQCNLANFWELLNNAISEEGLLLSTDAEVRAVVGEPGSFFGRYSAITTEGRWKVDFPDGVWCAYRRGYGESHWMPTLISVEGDERRAFDLFDDDEWRWALLARSRTLGPPEVLRRSGEEMIATWPLPAQLRAAMDIIGIPDGIWRWRVAKDAPDLWALLT